MEAGAARAQTILAHVVAMVGEAQRIKVPIQGLADRISSWFVPAIMVIAVVTFAVWMSFGREPRLGHALLSAISVVVIACPCALGLATPMSIMLRRGRGAREGVLVKIAEALQLLVAFDGHFAGQIAVADQVRQGAGDALAYLHDQGLRIVMLTGNNALTAQAVARKAGGFDEVRADLRPEDQARAIDHLIARGHKVAMAGDGINEAHALALAHVGIAMGTGADVVIENAAITLVRADLSAIVAAHRLARATMRNIRQNRFFPSCSTALGCWSQRAFSTRRPACSCPRCWPAGQ